MKFRTKVLWFLVLIFCLLLGASQVGAVTAMDGVEPADVEYVLPQNIEPIGGFIPIAASAEKESLPAVAHGGEHYMVVYNRAGHIYASVRNNTGHFVTSFLIDDSHSFGSPRIAYHAPSGLFLVTYNRPGADIVRLTAVSPTGQVGNIFFYYHTRGADIACNQNSDTCLLAYWEHKDGLDKLFGEYVTVGSGGITARSGSKNISNLSGRHPRLAWGNGTGRYLLTYTRSLTGKEYASYTHVYDLDPGLPQIYTHNSTDVIPNQTNWNDHQATGVAYDPCTQHFLVLFDHEFAPPTRDVWMAAIDKTEAVTRWQGHVAFTAGRKYSGGISFVTVDHLPPLCGVMNKLVATYANMDTKRIYAIEIQGNNDPVNPVYERDSYNHLEVVYMNGYRPNWWPVISGGSSNGEMFIAMDLVSEDDINLCHVFGRRVHVWEAEPEPIAADFTASPRSGFAPLTVNFSDLSQGSYTTCSWAFGDGATSTQCSPSHTYTAVGNYNVSLTVSGIDGSDTETKNNFIEVKPLEANFSASPTSGVAPLTVNFSDLSQGSYTTCAWAFGDGGTSDQCNPSHTYTSVGTYTVSLTVSGPGSSDTKTKTNYIEVKTLNADFSASPTSGVAPLTVNFSDLSQGSYTTCAWAFGDGGTSDQCNPSHTYTSVGTYTVSLTVSGTDGSDTKTKTNYVEVKTLNADFSASPTSGSVPLTVSFEDQSQGDYTTCAWTFGDGGSSDQCNPSHTYTAVGNYTVLLTVSGLGGTDTETKNNYIQVNPDSSDGHKIFLPLILH